MQTQSKQVLPILGYTSFYMFFYGDWCFPGMNVFSMITWLRFNHRQIVLRSEDYTTKAINLRVKQDLNCKHWNKKVIPDSKVHGANMGLTWVLSAPDGPMLAPWTLLSGMLWLLHQLLCWRFSTWPLMQPVSSSCQPFHFNEVIHQQRFVW